MMDKYAEFVDVKTGSLRFKGKATLNSSGVEFSSGSSFNISLDQVDTLDELGKGNYGTVYRVRHSRPKMRRPGLGLAGNKASARPPPQSAASSPARVGGVDDKETQCDGAVAPAGDTTGVVMAMKEIRLELDDAKFAAIIMELDILHRCVSPYIIDFYGAFFQEGAVYICMEYMNGGSIDKLYGDGIPEYILRKITLATTMGLKSLKDDHNIIHRDVKPTNILMNTRGQVKICDFGVSGNLVASIARTNIGCQSYMAPERISSGGIAQAGANPGGGTYSVQSDVWSLGLTIIECALGRYPYPPETYNNIFSQLSAIVDGDPPDLPETGYSDTARNFVRGCLHKIPKLRPTYAMLLQHPWLATLQKPATVVEEDENEDAAASSSPVEPISVIVADSDHSSIDGEQKNTAPEFVAPTNIIDKEVADWVVDALERRRTGRTGKSAKPALHAAPLDAMSSPPATS
jgi:mitogen-activated protein kinase kinase